MCIRCAPLGSGSIGICESQHHKKIGTETIAAQGFVRKCISIAQQQTGVVSDTVPRRQQEEGEVDEPNDDRLQQMFEKMLGVKTNKWEKVDFEKGLESLGLKTHFPPASWPAHHAVRELATQIKKAAKGCGVEGVTPYVYADLRK